MNILDILSSPWAIEPDKLVQMLGVYEAHRRGEKIDLAAVEAQLGRPLAREQQGYQVVDHVAVVPIDGVIAQRANLFSKISGGASAQLIERDIRGALADQAVRAIVLEVNSPGGTVHGTQELAGLIDRARAEKPIATFATGQMASAAYWIGAASDRVYVSGDNVFVGSIGVVATHVDRSEQQKLLGIKTTEVVAGRYKRVASEYRPLDKDGQAHMQEFVDYLYSVFVNDVAAYRGVSVDEALAGMADGRVFVGRQAIDAGLVDGVSTLDDLIATLASGQMPRRGPTRKTAVARIPSGGAPGGGADADGSTKAGPGGAPGKAGGDGGEATTDRKDHNQPPKGATMNREELKAAHPQLLEAILAEGHTTGAAAERARIQDVLAQGMPGHEALVKTLAFDGKTTGPEAAVQVLAAEKAKLRNKGDDLAADAAALAGKGPSPAADPGAAPAAGAGAASQRPVEERCKAKWDSDAAIRAEFQTLAAYTAYVKASESGRVRVLGGSKKAA